MQREISGVKLDFVPTPSFGVDVDFSSTGRTGSMPWNASFAFNNVNQLAVPIDQRNNELKAGTEWVNPKGMFRVDYWGSYFANDIQTLTWDNPIRATDFNNGLLPPNGPYDPSGYSNGNGPAFGQAALWPSNTLNSFGVDGDVQGAAEDHRQRQRAAHLHAAERVAAAVVAQHVDEQPRGAGRLPRPAHPAAHHGRGRGQRAERAGQLQQPADVVSHPAGPLPLQPARQQDAALRRP